MRRVSQDHRGKHTAGIDGTKLLTPSQRLRLAGQLQLTSKATPLRRTWIPKRGSPEKRPLGIPTQHERARQTWVRQVLEPEWEAKFSPHTYKPGHDILAIRGDLRRPDLEEKSLPLQTENPLFLVLSL